MILLTRPFADSKALAKILKKKGYNCFIEPMLEITYQTPNFEEYLSNPPQVFITTSKHARQFAPKEAPLIAIPEQGQAAAHVAKWIRKNLNPQKGKLVYLRGETISFDMQAALQHFQVEEIIVYKTVAPANFSPRLLKNFSKITLATFFSKQSLNNFLHLVEKNKLAEPLQNISLLTLSQNIAQPAHKFKWRNINIALEPTEASIIKKIDEINC